jgi:hypothetical protein
MRAQFAREAGDDALVDSDHGGKPVAVQWRVAG